MVRPHKTSDSARLRFPPQRFSLRRVSLAIVVVLAVYLLAAYLEAPWLWKHYFQKHPAMEQLPRITHTRVGIPGDPLNLALIGSEGQLLSGMHAAGWLAADKITFDSSVRMVAATVTHRPFDDAPVSSLYLWGRKEDLAFEQPVGHDPVQRHHVRFWKTPITDNDGRPIWVAAATFDQSVGFSHTTGQITHHIAAEIDAERDKVIADLNAAGRLAETDWVDHFHTQLDGRNGGGDPYHTDGRLAVGILKNTPEPTSNPSNL
jgi:hypothetical protein